MVDVGLMTMTRIWSLISSVVLVLLLPIVLLIIIGVFTGSMDLGVLELAIIVVIWVVGIILVVRGWVKKGHMTPAEQR